MRETESEIENDIVSKENGGASERRKRALAAAGIAALRLADLILWLYERKKKDV